MTLSKKSRKPGATAQAASHAHHDGAHHAEHHVHSEHRHSVSEAPAHHHAAPHHAAAEVPAPAPVSLASAAEILASTPVPTADLSALKPAAPAPVAAPLTAAAPLPKKNPLLQNFTPDDSVDSKKQFFRLMAEKIKEERLSAASAVPATEAEDHETAEAGAEPEEEPVLPNRSVGLYRKIAVRFLLLALVLVACVFYFSFTKLTISVKPNLESVNDTLMVDIYGGSQPLQSGKALRGQITRIDAEESGAYPASGEKSDQALVTGQVKLINNSAKNQPLVATTRLLSSDNKLFRLKNTVNVPAGGSIMAEVYADRPGTEMAIAASKFTIPGLWEGLQDKIYAESDAAFSTASGTKKIITQADIDAARNDLSKILAEKMQARASAPSSGKQVLAEVDPKTAQTEMSDKPGDQKDNFNIKVKNIATLVSFDTAEIKNLIRSQFASASGSGKILGDIADSDLSYSFDSYNAAENIATIKVAFNGRAASNKFDAIDRSKIVNLNQSQLEDYLKNIKEISSFNLEFFPSFIKKAPNLADRITIVVQP